MNKQGIMRVEEVYTSSYFSSGLFIKGSFYHAVIQYFLMFYSNAKSGGKRYG